MSGRCRLLFVVNCPAFFLSHRLHLALAAHKSGYDVHVATAAGEAVEYIIKAGLQHHTIPISRSGLHLLDELVSLWEMWQLMRQLRPNIVHLVTIKPVLYGGIAARAARIPGVVAAISGLGTVFISNSARAKIARLLIKPLYRLALNHKNTWVIFQNPDDRAVLTRMGAVRPDHAIMIRGSGVDLLQYPVLPETEGLPVVTFASRLLKDKGVEEFVVAANLLRLRNARARFWLLGSPDVHNRASVTEEDVAGWEAEGGIEYLGYRADLSEFLSRSHIIVLPSYREGLPKILIEAAASGRAVVTTDVPGCRDAIVPGETGLLVPVRNAEALADAIELLINDPDRRQIMGKAGRVLAEREFSIEKVIHAHLDLYSKIAKKVRH